MLGQRNSVMSRLRTQQPHLVAIHCNCHIAALIANASCKVLPSQLEDFTVDIWCYSQKSPKRLKEFKQFQSFVQIKPHKLLKSCQTRWLSLEACVVRLIEQYDALLSYFRSTEDRKAVVQRVKVTLEKPTTKACLYFLSVALSIVNNFNKFMQQQSPVIHKLRQEFYGLIRKLMLRFMMVKSVTGSSDSTQIDLDDISNHLPLEEEFIGHNTSNYLEENVDISMSDVKRFQEVCFAWWHTAVKESIKRLPLTHSVLNNLH